jgi:hypothetical protein
MIASTMAPVITLPTLLEIFIQMIEAQPPQVAARASIRRV